MSQRTTLPTGSTERKNHPIYSGPLRYFPAALAAVARVCKIGNDKHNPGQPLNHDRSKSTDHADCIVRHLIDMSENSGREPTGRCTEEQVCAQYPDCDETCDCDDLWDRLGVPQVVYVAWRALALCQEWLEKHEGAPVAPGATNALTGGFVAKVFETTEALEHVTQQRKEIEELNEKILDEHIRAGEIIFENAVIGGVDFSKSPLAEKADAIWKRYLLGWRDAAVEAYSKKIERRKGLADRRAERGVRSSNQFRRHNSGRRSTDTQRNYWLPDRRDGPAERRVKNIINPGHRRRVTPKDLGRRKTDTVPYTKLPWSAR